MRRYCILCKKVVASLAREVAFKFCSGEGRKEGRKGGREGEREGGREGGR